MKQNKRDQQVPKMQKEKTEKDITKKTLGNSCPH
jgi:hypothetical protein